VTFAPGAPSLSLRAVGVRFGERWALEKIDLDVRPGEPVGIAGPSGAGKSVLCAVVAGIVEPSCGTVRYGGKTMRDADPTVGLVLQRHGLLSGLTAAENVAFPLQARALEREETARRVARTLRAVGLSEHQDRPVDELSGGQRQRVGVARALAGAPSLLVADEPTAELDPDNRGRVLELLVAHAALGNLVAIASDDPDVLDACCTVVHLLQGAVVRATVTRSPSAG
jgi:ABC-type multidrug transport system ATPase subunit